MRPPSSQSANPGSDLLRRSSQYAVLGIIALAAVLLRAPGIMTSATFLDEGARIAVALPISQGNGLYTEVVHFGTPGPILFNALILRVFGPSILAVRIGYLTASILCLFLVFYVVSRTWGAQAALVSAVLFALSPFEVFYSSHAMSEPLMNLMVLGALAALVKGTRTKPFEWFAVAGSLTFSSALVKQPGILVLLPVAVFLLLDFAKSKDLGLLKQRGTGFVVGFVGLFLVWSIFLLHGGGWGQWYQEMVGSRVYRQAQPTEWTVFFTDYVIHRGFMILGIFGLLLPSRAQVHAGLFRSGALITAAFTLTLPLTYEFGGFSHYLLILEPWWIILAGATTHWLIETVRLDGNPLSFPFSAKRLFWLAIVALFLVSAASQVEAAKSAVETNATWWKKLSEERKAAERITGSQSVLVLANPIYHFHTGTRPPMRPMKYFLVFHLRFFQGVEREELVLEQLAKAKTLYIDSPRWELIASTLARADAPRLQLIEGPPEHPWPKLYRIDHTREDEAETSSPGRR